MPPCWMLSIISVSLYPDHLFAPRRSMTTVRRQSRSTLRSAKLDPGLIRFKSVILSVLDPCSSASELGHGLLNFYRVTTSSGALVLSRPTETC